MFFKGDRVTFAREYRLKQKNTVERSETSEVEHHATGMSKLSPRIEIVRIDTQNMPERTYGLGKPPLCL